MPTGPSRAAADRRASEHGDDRVSRDAAPPRRPGAVRDGRDGRDRGDPRSPSRSHRPDSARRACHTTRPPAVWVRRSRSSLSTVLLDEHPRISPRAFLSGLIRLICLTLAGPTRLCPQTGGLHGCGLCGCGLHGRGLCGRGLCGRGLCGRGLHGRGLHRLVMRTLSALFDLPQRWRRHRRSDAVRALDRTIRRLDRLELFGHRLSGRARGCDGPVRGRRRGRLTVSSRLAQLAQTPQQVARAARTRGSEPQVVGLCGLAPPALVGGTRSAQFAHGQPTPVSRQKYVGTLSPQQPAPAYVAGELGVGCDDRACGHGSLRVAAAHGQSSNDSSCMRERNRRTALVCSWLTRDSVTPSTSPISRNVRFS
jgi:hypothetical protein